MNSTPRHSRGRQPHEARTPYGIFLAVMTVFSLITTAVLAMDWSFPFVAYDIPGQIVLILGWVDIFFCGLFLLDWLHSLVTAEDRTHYLFGHRPGRSLPYGVLELFGTIPFVFPFRLLRLFRLSRMGWHLADLTPRALYRAVMASRAESALLITFLVAFLVVVLGSISVLYYEYDEPFAAIDSAEDAFWWAIVTITTVGYGDEVPMTTGGRFVGSLTMFVGIGIFGVIAGSLASFLTQGRSGGGSGADPTPDVDAEPALAAELASLRAEVAELSRLLRTAQESRQ